MNTNVTNGFFWSVEEMGTRKCLLRMIVRLRLNIIATWLVYSLSTSFSFFGSTLLEASDLIKPDYPIHSNSWHYCYVRSVQYFCVRWQNKELDELTDMCNS